MRIVLVAVLLNSVCLMTGATELNGGTECVKITANNGAGQSAVSVNLTNKIRRPIHDFIVTVVRGNGGGPNINEASEADTSGHTDFDVDDNGNNMIDAGEDAADTQGAMPEGVGHADNQPAMPGTSVRMINTTGTDIGNNDTFGIDLRLSGNLVAGDEIKVTPTSTTGLPILMALKPDAASVGTILPDGSLVTAATAAAAAAAAADAKPGDLNGGTETTCITANNGQGFSGISLSLTNKMRRPIHDFIVTVISGDGTPININEISESDTNGMTDFDVDDNGNNMIDPPLIIMPGEDTTDSPMEGSGHPDNQPFVPSNSVRIINTGMDDIGSGDTFGLDIHFSRPLKAGDKIKVTPTSTTNLPMLAMYNGNITGPGLVALDSNHLIWPQGSVQTRNDTGDYIKSLAVCGRGVKVTFLASESQGVIASVVSGMPGGWLKNGSYVGASANDIRDHAMMVISTDGGDDMVIMELDNPVPPGEKFSFEFALDRFGGEQGNSYVTVIPNYRPGNTDTDKDRIPDCQDNCPGIFNPDQRTDGMGVGLPCGEVIASENPFGGTQGSGGATAAAADTNRIDIDYDPTDSDTSSPCERIYFIQTMVICVDGDIVEPGDLADQWDYRDPTVTDDGTHVDRLSGRMTPYYGGNGMGTGHSSPGSHSGGGSTNATMDDSPMVPSSFFMPGGADTGPGYGHDYDADVITFKFETCAFCAAGEDIGDFFDCILWEYTRTRAQAMMGHRGTSTVTDSNPGGPSSSFTEAVDAWVDNNEDFNLPGN